MMLQLLIPASVRDSHRSSFTHIWLLLIPFQSIEQKQIAQQQAFQARYQVEEAKQTKQQKIVAAQGEAESWVLFFRNPSFKVL